MHKMLLKFLLISVSVLMIGCGTTRVVFVDRQADLVRVGPSIKGKVYWWDGEQWTLSANKVELHEGAYIGFVDDNEREGEGE